jgi:hypothetical protein
MVEVLTLTADTTGLKPVEPMLKGIEKQAAKTEVATRKLGRSSETELTKGAKGAQALDASTKKLDASTKAAASAQNQMAAATARATAATVAHSHAARGSAMQIGNIAAQFNDIGVMMAAGQNPIQLALQQGTQLGQVFNQMGGGTQVLKGLGAAFMSVISPVNLVTIGVIAGGAALVNWLTSSEDAADATERLDDAMSMLAESTDAYLASSQLVRTSVEELTKTYGTLADEVVRANQAQAGQDLQNQMAAQASAAQALLDQFTVMDSRFSGVSQNGRALVESFRVMSDQFGLTDDEAQALVSSLEGLANARGPDQVAQAALQVQYALDGARDSAGQLPPPLADAYGKLTEMITAAGQVRGELQQYPGILGQGASAAGVMAGQVSGIGSAAQNAATKLWNMVGAMGKARNAAINSVDNFQAGGLAAQYASYGAGRVQGEQAVREQGALYGGPDLHENFGAGGGGSRGGGGSSAAASEAEKEAAAIQKVNEALQQQIDMIGLSDEARRVQQEIQKAGVDLNSAEGQAIEALVIKLTQLEEAHKRAAEIGKALAQGLEDIFVAALSGADAAREAASKLLMELGRMLIHQAFQQLTKGLTSGGGGGLGGLLGGLFGGARAGGGPVTAGTPYMVNENTPRSEVFVPSKSGAILNVPQAQKALAGAAGGGSKTEVNVMAVNDYASAAREFRRQFRNDPGVESDIAHILERLGQR